MRFTSQHLQSGKKGKLDARANCARVATNARTGPVDPIIVKGCAEKREYINPQIAVELIISIAPMAPSVATANKPPNPTAGARQAKNKKRMAARHF